MIPIESLDQPVLQTNEVTFGTVRFVLLLNFRCRWTFDLSITFCVRPCVCVHVCVCAYGNPVNWRPASNYTPINWLPFAKWQPQTGLSVEHAIISPHQATRRRLSKFHKSCHLPLWMVYVTSWCSRTFLEAPPHWPQKCGLSKQVLSDDMFSYKEM